MKHYWEEEREWLTVTERIQECCLSEVVSELDSGPVQILARLDFERWLEVNILYLFKYGPLPCSMDTKEEISSATPGSFLVYFSWM